MAELRVILVAIGTFAYVCTLVSDDYGALAQLHTQHVEEHAVCKGATLSRVWPSDSYRPAYEPPVLSKSKCAGIAIVAKARHVLCRGSH